MFQYSDLGVVQKWVMLLLCGLVLYDDPLYPFKSQLPKNYYEICLSVFESTFIAFALFFWILVVHSIAQSEQLLNIRPVQFYRPKVLICVLIWVYLLSQGLLTKNNTHKITLPYQLIGFSLLAVYLIYFGVVAYSVLKLVKQMKKSYKILV